MFQTIRVTLLLLLFTSVFASLSAQIPGTLDNTFAGSGTTTIDFSSLYEPGTVGTATLPLSNGKILIGGIVSYHAECIVMRLNSNGSIDNTFGANGAAVIRNVYSLNKLAIQTDGKIIAVGQNTTGGELYACRLTANGLIDSSFGGGDGVYTYRPAAGLGVSTTAEATDVAVLIDNKILIVGVSTVSTFTPPSTQSITQNQLLIRLNADGAPDNTFNSTGIYPFFQVSLVASPGNPTPSVPSKANCISVQADGKIVVGGTKGIVAGTFHTHQNITVARFLSTGALDNSFNGSGLVEINLRTFTGGSTTTFSSESAEDLEVLSDGKILILSNVANTTSNQNIIGLVRLTATGTLDNSFGQGGSIQALPTSTAGLRTITPMSMARTSQGKVYLAGLERFFMVTSERYAHTVIRTDSLGRLDSSFNASGSLRIDNPSPAQSSKIAFALQSDGKPILVGNSQGDAVAAFRLTTNGALDNTFNSNGINIFNNPNSNSDDVPWTVASSSDGKIAVAGTAGDGDVTAVALFNDNGTPVASFGNNGKAILKRESPSSTNPRHVAFQPDGKLLILTNSGVMLLRRLNTNGTPDSSFSGDGLLPISSGQISPEKFKVLSNGKILLMGSFNSSGRLMMLNANGSTDNTFGSNGFASVVFGTSAGLYDALILNDGKILAVGIDRIDGSDIRVLLTRFNPNGTLDTSFSSDGIATISNLNAFSSCVFAQSDGKYVVGGFLVQSNPVSVFAARFLNNGALDTTFGMNQDSTFFRKGVARLTSPELTTINAPKFIVVDADGKIMMTARTSSGAVIVQFRENGRSISNNAIDSSFVGDGVARYVAPTSVAQMRDMDTRPDGRILLTGTASGANNTQDFWVARLFNTIRFGSSVAAGQTGQIVLGSTGATLNITGNSGSGGTITASVSINPTIVGALPTGVNQLFRERFWTITTSATGLTYNLTLDLSGISGIRNFNSIRILKRNNSSSAWQDVSRPPINATVSYNAPFITVSGLTSFSDFAAGQDSTTQLTSKDEPTKPLTFALRQNYPNPFNPTTVITYELPSLSDVRVELFDVLGRKVATLVQERKSAGIYAFTLNASNYGLSSGVYFYRIQAGQFVETKKMLLLK